MTITTPTIMKILVSSSPVVLGEVGGERGIEVKPVARMVGGEGVADSVVTIASPDGEERGDGGSPGIRTDDTIVAVIVHVHNYVCINFLVAFWYLPILRLIIGAELAISLRAYKSLGSDDISKPQTLGDMLRA